MNFNTPHPALNQNLNWSFLHNNSLLPPKLKSFLWTHWHKKLFLGSNISNSTTCSICNLQANYEHLFNDCFLTKDLVNFFQTKWKSWTGSYFPQSWWSHSWTTDQLYNHNWYLAASFLLHTIWTNFTKSTFDTSHIPNSFAVLCNLWLSSLHFHIKSLRWNLLQNSNNNDFDFILNGISLWINSYDSNLSIIPTAFTLF